MVKEIYQITREKHLDHLIKVMPFMAIIYSAQCYFFMQFSKSLSGGVNVGNYCFALGVSLATMIALMYHYNTAHDVKIYHNHINIKFSLFFINKMVKIQDIEKIEITDPEMSFSNISIKTAHGKRHNIYFVDNAKEVVDMILKQKTTPEVFSDAA